MSLTGVLTVRVDGRPIALARGLLALALAVCVLEVAVILSGIAEGKLRYPGISVLPAPTADTAQAFLIVGLLAAALILLGLCAGVAAAAGSMLLTVALLWDQQTYSNHLVLVILLLAYLSFGSAARIGDSSSHAASATVVFMMVSNSMGVKRPRAACRRRRW
uniref:HTTM domain-containing protein n=1 Tax=Agrococcus sp. KRD186 TaxID=2729730 RepID=UPI0019D0250A|nr:HTTM domain-containing protein [Agrococcus sp. KRD186]